jgi:hypothetical protein
MMRPQAQERVDSGSDLAANLQDAVVPHEILIRAGGFNRSSLRRLNCHEADVRTIWDRLTSTSTRSQLAASSANVNADSAFPSDRDSGGGRL